MMKVGRIAYLNVEPFFHFWPSDAFQLVQLPPRQLAHAAAEGRVDAGPLPIVEGWKMEKDFEPMGRWGISSRERSGSVYVMSRKPFSALKGATIGVTEDTSTSAMLARLLLNHRDGQGVTFRRGLLETDDAWLTIGNQALGYQLNSETRPFPHLTDLATEWWNWQKKPFVFAQWVVRRAAAVGDRARLDWLVGESLDRGLAELPAVSAAAAAKAGFPADAVQRYLGDFSYELGAEAQESSTLFRRLLDDAGILQAPVAPAVIARNPA